MGAEVHIPFGRLLRATRCRYASPVPPNAKGETSVTIHRNLRRALDVAYERVRRDTASPIAFNGNYGLCLGIIMGGQACNGMTEEEAAGERAHLAMLVALHDMQTGGRGSPSAV
ncbi:hypothetical protein [Paraburkholderia gardini]|uniref:hypothetical protein n=1 Tax=Paraburkholderia gardini TaxID=2823469 RepID=UPI001E5DD8BE|nr:hypothetical protein [Paraburkholderia gardini]